MGLTQLQESIVIVESNATGCNGKLGLIMPACPYQVKNFIRDRNVMHYTIPHTPPSCVMSISASACFLGSLSTCPPQVSWAVSHDILPRNTKRPERHRSEERRVGKECRSRWAPY